MLENFDARITAADSNDQRGMVERVANNKSSLSNKIWEVGGVGGITHSKNDCILLVEVSSDQFFTFAMKLSVAFGLREKKKKKC